MRNTTNGKRYVGQTRQTVAVRWSQHVSAARRPRGNHFLCAIRKYGQRAFVQETLEEVPSLEMANEAEQRWISYFNSNDSRYGYNLDAGGNARLTNPLSRARQSAAQKARFAKPGAREKLAESTRGRHLSEEHRLKLSVIRKGHQWTKGKRRASHTAEHRAKIAEAMRGNQNRRKKILTPSP